MNERSPIGVMGDHVDLAVPWVEGPFFARDLETRRGGLTPEEIVQIETFRRDGYLVIPGLVPPELCDRVRAECEPFFLEESSIEERRIQDAWRRGAASVLDLAVLPPVLRLLERIYERRPIPFQTLVFRWGSEQSAHADAMHFSSLPARFMCGVWVALEDVGPSNGPLFYYPGSHRLPEVTIYDLRQSVEDASYPAYERYLRELMEELAIEPVEFHARKGDVLVWCSNIVHGGRPVVDPGLTRWSQVTHVYFEDCVYYTPVYSVVPFGEFALKSIVDLTTLDPVEHRLDCRPVKVDILPSGRSRLTVVGPAESARPPAANNPVVAADLITELSSLHEQLAAAKAEVSSVRASASYRVGHAVLEPARAAQRIAERRRQRGAAAAS